MRYLVQLELCSSLHCFGPLTLLFTYLPSVLFWTDQSITSISKLAAVTPESVWNYKRFIQKPALRFIVWCAFVLQNTLFNDTTSAV